MVRRKGKCPEWNSLENVVRAKLPARAQPSKYLVHKVWFHNVLLLTFSSCFNSDKENVDPWFSGQPGGLLYSVGRPPIHHHYNHIGCSTSVSISIRKEVFVNKWKCLPWKKRGDEDELQLWKYSVWQYLIIRGLIQVLEPCHKLGKAVSVAMRAGGEVDAVGASASWGLLRWTPSAPSLCPRGAGSDKLG